MLEIRKTDDKYLLNFTTRNSINLTDNNIPERCASVTKYNFLTASRALAVQGITLMMMIRTFF